MNGHGAEVATGARLALLFLAAGLVPLGVTLLVLAPRGQDALRTSAKLSTRRSSRGCARASTARSTISSPTCASSRHGARRARPTSAERRARLRFLLDKHQELTVRDAVRRHARRSPAGRPTIAGWSTRRRSRGARAEARRLLARRRAARERVLSRREARREMLITLVTPLPGPAGDALPGGRGEPAARAGADRARRASGGAAAPSSSTSAAGWWRTRLRAACCARENVSAMPMVARAQGQHRPRGGDRHGR